MQRTITIELGERDATLAADVLEQQGRIAMDTVQALWRNPIDVEWDPQERFEEGVRLCSTAIQLRIALTRFQADGTASLATDPATEPSKSAGRDVPTADNGELVTHQWRIGDQVHHVGSGWVDAWRGSVSCRVNKNQVAVAWNDGLLTTVLASHLEADDGRQS